MPYREPAAPEPYSLKDLDRSFHASCAVLLWELVCLDPSTAQVLNELLADVGADESFGRALDEARRLREQKPRSWGKELERQIARVDDQQARELIYIFLFDVASLGLLNPAEQAFIEELRVAWSLPPVLDAGSRDKPAHQLSAEEREALMELLLQNEELKEKLLAGDLSEKERETLIQAALKQSKD